MALKLFGSLNVFQSVKFLIRCHFEFSNHSVSRPTVWPRHNTIHLSSLPCTWHPQSATFGGEFAHKYFERREHFYSFLEYSFARVLANFVWIVRSFVYILCRGTYAHTLAHTQQDNVYMPSV